MIATIIGAVTGFGGSVIPAVLNHFTEKQKSKVQLEQMKMQADLVKVNADIDLKKFFARANDDEHARLIEHDIALAQGKGFFAGLRSSVRPVITYLFFALFATVEGVMIWYGLQNGSDMVTVMNEVWDEETQAIFAAIISFWFGSRALEKNKK